MERLRDNKKSGDLVERDALGRFIEGHKKIGGRVVGSINLNTMIMQVIKGVDITESLNRSLFVVSVIELAINKGNVKMMAYLWERVDGKPK